MPTNDELKILQALPLDLKIIKTKRRIQEWVQNFGLEGVFVSFSGGKDSTVLMDIVRKMYPSIEAVYVNTGLEYPEIQQFVKRFENVTVLRPRKRFDEILTRYGYPVISKEVSANVSEAKVSLRHGKDSCSMKKLRGERLNRNGEKSQYNLEKWYSLINVDFNVSDYCCNYIKKEPIFKYEKLTGKVSITAQMAEESRLRKQQWIQFGCNAYKKNAPISNPMSFWKEQDVLQYIIQNGLEIVSVYGDIVSDEQKSGKLKCTGCSRTGCIFCAFGAHLDKGESRFEKLRKTHRRQYDYCLNGGSYDSDGFWKPNKNGLGMKHVFDELNKIYGESFIRY